MGAFLLSENCCRTFANPNLALTLSGSILRACLKYLADLYPSPKFANRFAK